MSIIKILYILLIFLFIIDVLNKYFSKPKAIENKESPSNKNEITENTNKNDKQNDIEDDFEYANDDINRNKKIEIIIKYDKYMHQKDFRLLKNKIENEYNNINIKGEEYLLPKNKRYFINFTYITQIFTCLLLLYPKYLKMGLPFLSNDSVETITKYNYLIIICNFILHFLLNRHISQTGAFEILFNDKKIYSKLEMKNLPDINKLKNILNKINIS